MKYSDYVVTNGNSFSSEGLLKVAQDLADILDNPQLQINLEEKKLDSYKLQSLADARLEVFNDFCAICMECEVEDPVLEPGLYEVHLPDAADEKSIAKALTLKKQVLSELRGKRTKEAIVCRSAAMMVELFPNSFGDWGRIDGKSILAIINSNLVKLGCEPIRPDYSSREVAFPTEEIGPKESTDVLIVDDDLKEIVKTARNLAGWPNLKVSFLYCQTDYSGKREAKVQEIAGLVIERAAKIVLMDQGMPPVDGHQVVKKVRETTGSSILFIANTGGSPEELYQVGCLSNCEKGRDLSGLRRAVRLL